MAADYPSAGYYPASTNNYTQDNRPYSDPINKLVIHVTEGSWSSAINWFANPNAQASAHYMVRSADGYIGQSVLEKDIAYHSGNWDYNVASVGIEHEGYSADPSWFTDAMYRSSAKLSAYLCDKYKIPIDRTHIIGHNEVPDPYNTGQYGGAGHHTDPGPYWNWNLYISYIQQYAASSTATPSYTQVVDNTTASRFSASRNWSLGSWNNARYGPDYRYTTPKAVSDVALYKVKIPATGNYDVYAHWPAASGYNTSAPFGIQTTSGLKWVRVDQTQNGGKWNHLGNFNLAAGDGNYVRVSRWTQGKGYVIADAVMVSR